MKKQSLLLALTLMGISLSAQAQYVGESVYYSRLQFGGPARTQGIAGANVALGGDFGNLSSNPAGLGFYRKSEINFSPGLGLGMADANGTGPTQNQTKNSFHIASVGLVFTNRLADDDASSDWRGGSFALGFSRLADFNTSFHYSGTVDDSKSLFQRLREPNGVKFGASGYNAELDEIEKQYNKNTYTSLDGLAYGTYLTAFGQVRIKNPSKPTADTSTVLVDNIRTTRGLERTMPVTQSETVTHSGSVSQFDLGYGGSYKERLFIGGAVGIVSSTSRTVRDYTETSNPADTQTAFGSLTLHDEVKTVGTGINARLGLIYRVNDVLRVGGSVQTPTYMQLTDTYGTSLTSRFSRPVDVGLAQPSTGTTLSQPGGQYAYSLITPFRANGGLALLLGKHGFVTGDVEYLSYQQASLRGNPNDANGDNNSFAAENKGIDQTYQNAVNVRIGTEVRLGIFRLRGGYAHYGDPYRNSTVERTQEFYTGGLGFRSKDFFLDVAEVYTAYNQLYSPYDLSGGQQPVINISNHRYTTTVTAGFTF